MTVRVGISGWTYKPWRGVFYPAGLPARKELPYAAERMSSIEINGSFYALQRPSSWQSWYAATPADFVFAVKGGRFITHMKRLTDPQPSLANFFASGVLALGEKLGPLLWQLPPNMAFELDRIAGFFAALPRTTSAAAVLAGQHDERMAGRSWTTTDAERPMRHAMEVRHASFAVPEFADLARKYGVALVTADTAGKWPMLEAQTADFAYVRLHGDEELYVSGYSAEALDAWAEKVRRWANDERDVFVYFDNDVKVRAPFDAIALADRLR